MLLQQLLKTWRVIGSAIIAEIQGGFALNDALWEQLVTITYVSGGAMAMDASQGSMFVLTITDGVAYTIPAPSNTPVTGFSQRLLLTIRNTSGGVLGAATFNAIYKLGAAWTNPANGFSRSIEFRWNGTNWVEYARAAADVAN